MKKIHRHHGQKISIMKHHEELQHQKIGIMKIHEVKKFPDMMMNLEHGHPDGRLDRQIHETNQ